MKTKKTAIILTMVVLTIVCAGILVGCGKPKPPYSVKLDIYQPNGVLDTEKSLSTSLSLKYDGKPKVFDFKVYNKDLKRYLVDDDMKNGNLNSKIRVSVKHGESTEHFSINFEDDNSWPTEVGNYDIIIRFNMPVGVGPALDEKYSIAEKRIYLTIEEE